MQPLFVHGFFALSHLLLSLVLAYLLLFRRKSGSDNDRAENNRRFRHYNLAVLSSWGLAAFHLLLSAYSYFLYRDTLWSDVAMQLDVAARAAAWLLLSAYLQIEFDRCREEQFPAPLRLWWALFLLLSAFALTVHLTNSLHGLPVAAHLWALDSVSFLAALVLLFAGFLGKEEGGGSPSEEPLLNGANDVAERNANASIFTGASFLSILTFSWMGPLLAVGHKKMLGLDDIPALDDGDSVRHVLPQFKNNLESLTRVSPNADASRQKVTSFKLAKALVLTVWQQVALTALYALVYNLASYVGPYLVTDLVQYLKGDKRFGNKQGFILVLGFVGAKALECLSQRHWYFRMQQAGIRLSAALAAVVYEKGLALSSKSRQSRTSGEMINIITVDANRVGNFSWYLHSLWLVPVQVGLALFILYSNVGLASLAALAAMVVVMLTNVTPGQMQQKYQKKLMESKDIRMKATAEILRNMRVLKLQGWEMKFLDKVIELRKTETNWLMKYLYTGAVLTFVFWGAPTFVAAVTFGTCVITGIPLASGKVLSALATFRVLQGPIYALPGTISMVIQTKVSLDRIVSFLCLEEMATDAVQKLPSGSTELAIEVCNGSFSWDLEASPEVPTLKDLQFRARHGMRVAVCGTVGSGKSSLLSCILGEIPKLLGEVKTCGMMAYVSQSAWIQSGTIQDNILFGKEMHTEMYDRVLEACSLRKDLEILPFGDQTVVGERGINLSGGQKQRIQIGRALYRDADIYLFDDPFSAVDAHTGSHLFKECLLGLLASKTVVYVTHQIEFLPAADLILVMKDGRIVQSGKYNEILSSGEFMELLGAHKDALTALDSIHVTNRSDETSSSNGTVRVASQRSSVGAEKKENQNGREDGGGASNIRQLVEEEQRDKGRVGFRVYWKYLTLAYGGVLVPLVLLVHILFQVFQIAGNYWMAWAVPASDDVGPPVSMSMLIDVYVTLALASSFCVLVRTVLLVTAAYKTATLLFNKMHVCIFRAPMSFFDSTPSGRILNRVSTDQSKVDTSIAHQMGNVAFSIIQLVGVIAVISQVAWQVFIVFIPMFAACFWYQQYYIATARELQRIQGVCRAPIMQHFSESIIGSSTIRSFGKEEQFVSTNSHLLDTFFRPCFYSAAAMEWLCLHLDAFSSLIFAFSVIFLINLPSGLIDPAIVGLAITYGLDLNTLQAGVFWHICALENNIISVERIWHYIGIPLEPPLSMSSDKLEHNWPSKGEIELHNLHVKYAPQMPFVLKGLTCTFLGGTKTGIVGRTGSGKSTLIQTLFRIVDPTVGQIIIDGIDICTLGLHDLRYSLSIIPQDPTMFEGTVRSNLDPLAEYADEQIWEALDCCQLGDKVRKKEMKLDSPVIENGENWSVGQRQLVCLGRVILKRSKILVLDEATASVDTATDNLIQKTLRQQFSEATVITIAHRLTSILDSDMVLLLDNGVVVEHDMPGKLVEDKSSLFAKLVAEYMMRSIHT